MKYTQLVLVEFYDSGQITKKTPFVYKFVSEKPITFDSVVQYFVDTQDFNEERDSITFIADKVTEIHLDNNRRGLFSLMLALRARVRALRRARWRARSRLDARTGPVR